MQFYVKEFKTIKIKKSCMVKILVQDIRGISFFRYVNGDK